MPKNFVIAAVAACTTALSVSVLGTGVAVATPPSGVIAFTDLARAQAVESASIPIKPGLALVSGSYSVASGGETGWRRLPGPAVLAVTKGAMTVSRADGCSTKDYADGQAAVIPAGTYKIDNSGKDPLQFFGMFFDQAVGAPKPLTEGSSAAAPAKCPGFRAASAAPSGVTLAIPKAATMVAGMFGGGATVEIKAGKDVYADYLDISPGFSTGWISHLPAVNIMSGGVFSYVMARDGKCDDSEHYTTGQAFYHPAHRHIGYNGGKEHVFLTSMYFDLPHEPAAPVIGNTITAVDFTQAPPADCVRLR